MRHRHGGMNFDKFLRDIGPVVAAAAVGGVMAAACKNKKFDFDWDGPDCGFGKGFGSKAGVPLEELDMGDEVPSELVLAGADSVVITEGEDFAIAIQGDDDAKEALRFRLEGGALHVASENSSCDGEGIATINVTMPAPSKVTIAGSGEIAVSDLASDAEIKIAGSGQISVLDVDCEALHVKIAGSGCFTAGGKTKELHLSIAGSGHADMSGLIAEEAKVHLAGSGSSTFACDGEVDAKIMGSGSVTVRGSARCRVHSFGSGELVCEPREDEAA